MRELSINCSICMVTLYLILLYGCERAHRDDKDYREVVVDNMPIGISSYDIVSEEERRQIKAVLINFVAENHVVENWSVDSSPVNENIIRDGLQVIYGHDVSVECDNSNIFQHSSYLEEHPVELLYVWYCPTTGEGLASFSRTR